MKVESGKTYIGVVENNEDPKKLGRCKIRVLDVFDKTDIDDIPWANPWKDLVGNEFAVPEKGKIVTVVFENGNTNSPEFIFSDHYNINLEKKLESLSTSDYISMKSLIFDHKTQVYVNDSEGLKLDHKFNVVNIKDKSINLNLKDNFSKVNLGTENSTQRSILGDNFLNWFDGFIQILLGGSGGPFLGNLGAPVIPTPALIGSLQLYQQLKDPKFLSKNVYIVDNENVAKLDRIAEGQIGDNWKSTVEENKLTTNEPVPFTPTEGSTDTTFDQPPIDAPVPAVPSTPAVEEKPTPQENPDVKILLDLMKSKKYTVYEDDTKVNIIAIRNQCINIGDKYSDQFVDKLYVIWKKDGNWQLKQWMISTVPGTQFTITDSWLIEKNLANVKPWVGTTGKKINMKEYVKIAGEINGDTSLKSGLPILVPSQYVDLYYISTYKGEKSMDVVFGAQQLVWRDKDVENFDVFNPNNFSSPEIIEPNALVNNGLKLHLGYPGGVNVGNWSEGSTVFSKEVDLKDFFTLCEEHAKLWGNIFTFTLATKVDFEEASKRVSANESQNTIISPTQSQTTPGPTQSGQSGTQSAIQQTVSSNKSEVIDVFGDGKLLIDVYVQDIFNTGVVTTDDISRVEDETVVFTIKSQAIQNQWQFVLSDVTKKKRKIYVLDAQVTSLKPSRVVYNFNSELFDYEISELPGEYSVNIKLTLSDTLSSNSQQKTISKTVKFKVDKGSTSTSQSMNSNSNDWTIAILNPTTENSKKVTGKISFSKIGPKTTATGIISGFPDGGTIGPINSSPSISDNNTIAEEMMIILENKIIEVYNVGIKLVVVEKG